MPAAVDHSGGSQAGRLRLVEFRLDEHKTDLTEIRQEIKDIAAGINKKVDKVYSLMFGVLCSVVAACILLVINVAVGAR